MTSVDAVTLSPSAQSVSTSRFHTALNSIHPPRVESLNALDAEDYFGYIFPLTSIDLPPRENENGVSHAGTSSCGCVQLQRYTAAQLSCANAKECLDLIQETSKGDYVTSSMGWSRRKKAEEMRLPDLRYVLLRSADPPLEDSDLSEGAGRGGQEKEEKKRDTAGELLGFMSFMLTYEDGIEVIYLYEIHLRESLRGCDVGARLIATLEAAGRATRMRKVMLTVFRANKAALRFYDRLGYAVDDFSPPPRKLRGGIVKEPDYLILSKELPGADARQWINTRKRRRLG